MRRLRLITDRRESATFLFLGAHCDDIEIGCGGALLRLTMEYPTGRFVWVVLSSDATRASETRESYAVFLKTVANKQLDIQQFRDSHFPYVGAGIKDYFEKLRESENPDVIFTHYRDDRHQDHRLVSELTWNTFRDHFILEYEIPKYDGDLGSPNFFVPLTHEMSERKVSNILKCFKSQRSRRWFTRETFLGLMRMRGVECNAEDGYAEAFYSRKVVF